MSPRKHVTGPQAFICGGDLTSGPRDDCPNVLHDFPLPAGYVDASEAAEKRLRHRWHNARCPDCGLYGWRPGDPTGDLRDERVPAPVTDALRAQARPFRAGIARALTCRVSAGFPRTAG